MTEERFPETLELQITEEHIRMGRRNDWNSCPIALAAKEHFDVPKVYAGWYRINLSTLGESPIASYQHDGTAWVQAFDYPKIDEPPPEPIVLTLVKQKVIGAPTQLVEDVEADVEEEANSDG